MRYRLIETAGSEPDTVEHQQVDEEGAITLPDSRSVNVPEIYDDVDGREGGVDDTIVIDVA